MEVPVPLAVVAGEYMDSATVVQWLKQPGDAVRAGEALALVETAKATMEVPSPASGILVRTAFPVGADVPVGEVLGWIETEDVPRPSGEPPAPGRLAITPAARRLAAQLGVNHSQLRPTRPDGRITEADVRAAAAAATSATEPPAPDHPPPGAAVGQPYSIEAPTPYRKTTAQRMAASAAIPQFQLTVPAEVGALVQTRQRSGATVRPGLTAYLVKATADTLRRHPRLNSTFEEGTLRRFHAINLGVAVATAAGLVVPVIRDADRLSVREIGAQLAELRGRAAAQRLRIEDVRGGTFTISNLGQAGVLQFAALVNPPQTAILAVGALHNDAASGAPRLLLTLSCDHRALDGADGAEFLQTLRTLLEHPATWAGEG
jgi:pyruvate dehydrogenase E2 component (dihydrolipoamide acetyltransferase)